MTKTNNVIELNGKRYDAITGAFVGKGLAPVAVNSVNRPQPVRRSGAIDGFVATSRSHSSAQALAPKPAHPATHTSLAKPKPLTPHHPEHSKTLMRHAVKLPAIKPRKLKMQAPTDIVKTKQKPVVLSVKPKLSSEQIDTNRSARALTSPRSTMVRRFNKTSHQASTAYVRPAHTAASGRAAAIHPATTAQSQQKTAFEDDSIFDQALARAVSHEQPAPKESRIARTKRHGRKHARAVGISATVVAVLLLGGFIAYQNKADLQLQLASAKAGFQASMPGDKPTGYAIKGLNYSPGVVTIGFNDGGKSFNLTQKASNWDSETLLQNYVATANQPYNAYQAAGRTVYIYGNGNATWVNGGIWYQVNGNANLDKDQILNLATSM